MEHRSRFRHRNHTLRGRTRYEVQREAESLLEKPPTEGLPATADDLKSIAVSAKAFMVILNNVKAVEKALAAVRLNEDGSSKIKFEIGDQVPTSE